MSDYLGDVLAWTSRQCILYKLPALLESCTYTAANGEMILGDRELLQAYLSVLLLHLPLYFCQLVDDTSLHDTLRASAYLTLAFLPSLPHLFFQLSLHCFLSDLCSF